MERPGLTTVIFRSIDEIAPATWASIFPSVPENYAFYKVVEESFSDEYKFYYLTICKGSQIICLVPAFVTEVALDTTIKGPFKKLTRAIKKRLPHLFNLKVFICGSPLSGGKLGVIGQDQPEIARALNETISSLARQANLGGGDRTKLFRPDGRKATMTGVLSSIMNEFEQKPWVSCGIVQN